MRITVVGPGALGCLFAGLLAESGLNVSLLDKNRARAKQIDESGIRIDDENGTRLVKVKASADPGSMEPADALLLCVKAFDIGPAMAFAMTSIGPDTALVPFSNGLGNVEKIAEIAPKSQIVCGATTQGATAVGIGHVHRAGRGPTTLAPYVPKDRGKAEAAAKALSRAGIETSVTEDMQALIWNKLIISAAINPLSTVMNLKNGQLLENQDAYATLLKLAEEAAAVARKLGVDSPAVRDPTGEVEWVCRETAENISSMLQDARAGRKTEIEEITGMLLKKAREVGIPAPANEEILARARKLRRK